MKTVTCLAGGYVTFDGFTVELTAGREHPADSPIVKANSDSFTAVEPETKKKA